MPYRDIISQRYIDFHNLLLEYQNQKLIDIHWLNNEPDLYICNYTRSCQFDKKWDDITKICRGLIVSHKQQQIHSFVFPKFFNYGEIGVSIPNSSFSVYEKLDGSLGISYFHKGHWKIATRGSFNSDQAKWATEWLNHHKHDWMKVGYTYLFEIVYPENKIVVDYGGWSGLILIGVFGPDGIEIPIEEYYFVSKIMGFGIPNTYNYSCVDEIINICKSTALGFWGEGFVVKFNTPDNYRIKIKADEYVRLHRVISNITPLGIWDMLRNNQDDVQLLIELPEEIRDTYINIREKLLGRYQDIIDKSQDLIELLKRKHLWSDPKSISEGISKYYKPQPEWKGDPIPNIIFAQFNNNNMTDRTYKSIWNYIRPNNNEL